MKRSGFGNLSPGSDDVAIGDFNEIGVAGSTCHTLSLRMNSMPLTQIVFGAVPDWIKSDRHGYGWGYGDVYDSGCGQGLGSSYSGSYGNGSISGYGSGYGSGSGHGYGSSKSQSQERTDEL